MEKNKKNSGKHWLKLTAMLALFDVVSAFTSYFFSLLIRFDGKYSMIPGEILLNFYHYMPIHIFLTIFVMYIAKMYSSIWKFAGHTEAIRSVVANILIIILNVFITKTFFVSMPLAYYVLGGILQFIMITGVRFSYRYANRIYKARKTRHKPKYNVLIYGAGSAGRIILNEIRGNENAEEKVCCFADDNENLWNRYIENVKVAGGRNDILTIVSQYNIEKIYFAIRHTSLEERKNILDICKETGCEIKVLPALQQMDIDEIKISHMREVSIEDLLGREPITINNEEVYKFIENEVVLVTGGGGSIGSELCRQISAHNPKQLIIFDIYENNAYDIQQELKRKYPDLDLVVRIGSVRDTGKVYQLFREYKPAVVYHAAAHKHVPLMEDSPAEAIKNNVMGTYKTAFAAMANECRRFVLISTDKAVNPTNIMGASKRICEMIVQSFSQKISEGRANDIPIMFTEWNEDIISKNIFAEKIKNTKTEFVAVRFGNVLGSNGSVIPLFKKQIAEGGPVTVTHPNITRFFMTIPEAVSLVLQAGTYAHGGEIFVLDMGESVKIDTLARNLIKLSGYKPDEDIKIIYTGLRPGEKLYEEKLMAEEGLRKTDNQLIHIGSPLIFDIDLFMKQLAELMITAYKRPDDIKETVKSIVTTYKPSDN